MSENIQTSRRTNDACAQITRGCITLSGTCVVHTKSYFRVIGTCSASIREHIEDHDHRGVDGTTAHEKFVGFLLHGILHAGA